MSGTYGAIDSASWSDYASVLEHTQKRAGQKINQTPSVPVWTSCRWMVAYVCFAGSVVIASLQLDMSMALVCMFPRQPLTSNASNIDWVNLTHSNYTHPSTETDVLSWDDETQGLILSAAFYGAIISPILAGFVSTHYGGKEVLVISTSVAILSTVFTPTVAWISPWLVFTLRVFLGFATAMLNPAVQALLTKWSPVYDRAKMIAFCFSGVNLGNMISFIIPGLVCEIQVLGGWPLIFYLFSGIAVLWVIWLLMCVYNSPDKHPRISNIEQHYINSGMTGIHKTVPRLPWRYILTSIPLWVCTISQCINTFCQLVQQLNVPMYMRDVLQFSVEENGLLSALPAFGRLCGTIVCGFATDMLVRRRIVTVATTRKIFFIFGFIFPAGALLGLGYINSDQREYGVILLVIAGTTSAAGMLTIRVNLTDIAPRYASILLGILMSANGVVGIVTPVVVTMVTTEGTREQWQTIFTTCSGMYVFGAFIFVFFGSSSEQWWATESQESVGLLGEQSRDSVGFRNGYVIKNQLVIPDLESSDTEHDQAVYVKGQTFIDIH